MPVEIIDRGSQTRCHRCGEREISSVCHHCGRALCGNCSPPLVDTAGAPSTTEFTRLGLSETGCGESPVHCSDCDHVIRDETSKPLAAGGAAFVLGALAFIGLETAFGLLLMLAGAAVVVGGYFLNRARRGRAKRNLPALPVLSRIDHASARERLRGRIVLSRDGRCRVTTERVEGVITLRESFGKTERDRLERYRLKYKLDPVRFHSGFAVLRGHTAIVPVDGRDIQVIPLTGTLQSQPFLAGSDPKAAGERVTSVKYGLVAEQGAGQFPVRVVPSLVQQAARGALDFEVQWISLDSTRDALSVNRIESLELRVPISWGNILSMTDDALVGSFTGPNGEAMTTMTWKRISLSDDEVRSQRRRFRIKAENAIKSTDTITGQVEVSFCGALSGLTAIDLYFPLGSRRNDEDVPDIKTFAVADLDLSLACLRYQDTCVLPNACSNPLLFENVTPDHTAVIALTDALSDQERFHVKRVTENPPGKSGRADVVNRFWDIAGRYYDSVYPVDFHILLTGEEVNRGVLRRRSGATSVDLTVQGTFANKEMYDKIGNTWESLDKLIRDTLYGLPKATQSTFDAEAARLANIDRVHALRKQLDQLFEALTGGRISESLYVAEKARIEQEINGLNARADFAR